VTDGMFTALCSLTKNMSVNFPSVTSGRHLRSAHVHGSKHRFAIADLDVVVVAVPA
jgi:hypothetical protein